VKEFLKYSTVVRAEKVVKRDELEEDIEDATLLDVSYSKFIVEYIRTHSTDLDPLVVKRARVIGKEIVEQCSVR